MRFRRDFIQLLQQQHAATVIRRPISRWSEARRHDKVTVRELLDLWSFLRSCWKLPV